MGRELKRVALDFQWPLHKVWEGFKNPFYAAVECRECGGTGLSPYAKGLHDQWYGNAPFDPASTGSKPFTHAHPVILDRARRNYPGGSPDMIVMEAYRLATQCFDNHWMHHLAQEDVDALVKAGRLHEFSHVWTGKKWEKKKPKAAVTAAMVNEWSLSGMGHDSINCSVCVRARCKRDHQEHLCRACKGHGSIWPSKAAEKKFDNWKPTEPPKGEGYQIWETVSEGSPVSPMFATPERLAAWMVENDDSVTKDTTYDQWLGFIMGPGWA